MTPSKHKALFNHKSNLQQYIAAILAPLCEPYTFPSLRTQALERIEK